MKHIHTDKDRVIEGELRCKQLVSHLERTKSPKAIFLSEDASGVNQKVVYDSHTNQMVGIVLPFEDTNGMPKLYSFQAKTEEAMRNYMSLPKSTLVYIVVAQPLQTGSPPFILQMFGTANQFKTEDVMKRWRYIVNELKK